MRVEDRRSNIHSIGAVCPPACPQQHRIDAIRTYNAHTDGNEGGVYMDTGLLPYGSASIIEHENKQRQHKNVAPLWVPRAERR